MKRLKCQEIAPRIDAHLRRFEADPVINAKRDVDPGRFGSGWTPYWNAGAYSGNGASRVYVTYVRYQGQTALTREEAQRYLEWLDAGNVGRHHEALRA